MSWIWRCFDLSGPDCWIARIPCARSRNLWATPISLTFPRFLTWLLSHAHRQSHHDLSREASPATDTWWSLPSSYSSPVSPLTGSSVTAAMASKASFESEMSLLSRVLEDPVGFYQEVINRSGQCVGFWGGRDDVQECTVLRESMTVLYRYVQIHCFTMVGVVRGGAQGCIHCKRAVEWADPSSMLVSIVLLLLIVCNNFNEFSDNWHHRHFCIIAIAICVLI